MGIILGAVLFFTNGKCITNMPQWFRKFGLLTIGKIPDGNGGTLGIPVQILFFIFAGLITWAILHFTLIGRGAYSIGSNESSAVRVGYNVKHIQIFIYMYSGMMTGLAAVINTSIVQQVDPNTFSGFELSVISAVIIGGASSIGGEGSVFGTVLGVLLLAIINNGMILAKVPTFWQDIVMGLIILFAISINVINKNRAQRKLIRVDIEE
jgi:simple sugar transport system permease protein/ribose transport system permease protein